MKNAYHILKYLTVLLFLLLSKPVSHVDALHKCTAEYAHLNILRSGSYNVHLNDCNTSLNEAKVKVKIRVKYREEQCYYDIVLTRETVHLFFAISRVYTAPLTAPVFSREKYSFTLRGPPTVTV